MSRSFNNALVLPISTLVFAALALSGCGGGGGGGGSPPAGALVAVSFIGYTPAPGIGGNPGVPLPTVFRDQALEFQFDGPIDDPIFGGFFSQGGVNVEFAGVPPSGSQAIPYYAYSDQFAAHHALQIVVNVATATPLASYIVGRHRDKPDTIVLDPRVLAGNPLGLPVSSGFSSTAQYVFMIPSGSGLLFGGRSALPVGPSVFALPIVPPLFTTVPLLSGLFQTGISFGPNPIPPAVLSIVPQSGAAGTVAAPIAAADPIIVTFSQPVTVASLDTLKNFIVRNLNVTNTTFPGGILVPGSVAPQTPGATADVVFIYTPAGPYGPGVPPLPSAQGFDIEVRIGDIPYPQPNSVVPPIQGLPTGLTGIQLELSNSLSRIMRSTPCPGGCPTPSSIVEGFDNTLQKDTSFAPTFPNSLLGGTGLVQTAWQARWNDSTASSSLAGRVTTGIPTGNSPASLGYPSRIQFIVNPLPPSGPGGLFSPFDSNNANSGTQCTGTSSGFCHLGFNPNGGSHIMHIYESANTLELNSTEDSLEQIEWSSTSGVTAQTVYPLYSIWCGVSNKPAPLAGGTTQGLTAVFDANYTLTPYQTGIPVSAGCADLTATNPRKVPCSVGVTNYSVALATTQFYPFPVLNPCFDFSTSTGQSGAGVNLIFEQNIEPGNQVPNFNRFQAGGPNMNAFTPVRRLIDAPLSLVPVNQCAANMGGGFDVYRARFTFVGIVAQARSLWYDTGVADPNYLDFIVSPAANAQPLGTFSTWTLEGTDTSNPGPGTAGPSGVYIDGPAGSAVIHSDVLTGPLLHARYFRFRVELRGNNVANTTPAYSSVVMAYSF